MEFNFKGVVDFDKKSGASHGLFCCLNHECEMCPYESVPGDCKSQMMKDALEVIDALQVDYTTSG